MGNYDFTTPVRLTQQLTATLLTPATNEAEPTSRLVHEGRDTGVTLVGAVLEAAVELPAGWLVFLTHDVPYEEGLEIYLLSGDFAILDRATLAAPYRTGCFGGVEVTSPTALRFDFLGKRKWQVELLAEAGFRLPLVSEPAGVQRPLGFTRRFRIGHAPAC